MKIISEDFSCRDRVKENLKIKSVYDFCHEFSSSLFSPPFFSSPLQCRREIGINPHVEASGLPFAVLLQTHSLLIFSVVWLPGIFTCYFIICDFWSVFPLPGRVSTIEELIKCSYFVRQVTLKSCLLGSKRDIFLAKGKKYLPKGYL